MTETSVPKEAIRALEVLEELLCSAVAGVYLYGSAVTGGLRRDSDVDILAVIHHRLSEDARKDLAGRLMRISGRMGNADSVRPLEVTVLSREDIVPWRYPPRKEFIYGEWLRSKYEQGWIPEPAYDPDAAILLYQARKNSITLLGRDAPEILDPVPMADIRKAMKDCLPDLMKDLKGDERNVILTLARMWVTAATFDFLPKDAAAEWAKLRLPQEQADLLGLAGKAYRGEYADKWGGLEADVAALAYQMIREIESCLAMGA